MPHIILETRINAPIQRVFDLARSIDLHLISTKDTDEKAIDGRTTGLINANEFVTWQGKHLGFTQRLTSKIMRMSGPYFFEDKMLKGPLSKLEHQHHFYPDEQQKTIMKDEFYYRAPLGFLGAIANKLFLKRYLERVLIRRNHVIKSYAENDEKWMQVLNIY